MDTIRSSPAPPQPRRLPSLLLILTALFIFFFRLGGRGFENKDTIWYVEIAWEMLRSGDWIVPRFNTVIFTEKPILFIWAVAGLSRVAGVITPFFSRLPSALAALGCTFLTVSLGKTLFNRRTGLLAGFILCTTYAFAWEARTCMVDMLFTFFVTLSLYFLYRGFSAGGTRGQPFILAYLAIGLAALTKGPLGIVFPALVSLVYLAVDRRLRLLRSMLIPWGIVIVIGMQAAWYVPYLARIGPEGRRFFYEMYIYKENLLRFTSGFDHYKPFWFYGPNLFSHFLPWSPFLILCLFLPRVPGGSGAARDRRYPAVWFLSLLAFLTISSGKHSRYALPLYPAAALLVADFWDRLMTVERHPLKMPVVVLVAVLAVCGAAGFPVFVYHAAPALFPVSLAASAVLLGLVFRMKRAPMPGKLPIAFTVIVFAFACAWSAYIVSLPAHDARRAEHQRLAEDIAPAVRNDQLATYGPTQDKFGRRLALGFFIGRPVIFIDRESGLLDYLRSNEAVYCLLESAEYERLRRQLPATVVPSGNYRYRDNELTLIRNR
jgi:4-amino-4-deoxy-L-arabinose transferase-like glycosyltransferase